MMRRKFVTQCLRRAQSQVGEGLREAQPRRLTPSNFWPRVAAVLSSAPMSRSRLPILAGVILVLGILLTAWLWQRRAAHDTTSPEAGKPSSSITNSNRLRPTSQPPTPSEAAEQLRRALADVLEAADLAQRKQLLAEVRRRLETLAAGERQALLGEFLTSRRDADLGGQFAVGPEGGLTSSPTLRVWLLNELARLDPTAAAALGRQVLASMDSPDEWAVALRAVALGESSAEGRTMVKEKTLALLSHAEWQQQPSSGYLNAFDVAVHLKDREFAPVLSGLLRQTNQPALAHAAFLALDRLTLAAPTEYLQTLQTQPGWLEGREAARAGFFARADATDLPQRAILEQYLLDPRRSTEELNAFAETFPNASQFLSHNLLTRQAVFDGTALARRDAATLAIVRQWQTDPRFVAQRDQLRRVETRLQEFTRQAQKKSAP